MIETWDLTDEQREKFKPMVEDYIAKLEAEDFDDVNKVSLDLTFQGIAPRQLQTLLEELGYYDDYSNRNGWQCDYWIYMDNEKKRGYARRLCIAGCAMGFTMVLRTR